MNHQPADAIQWYEKALAKSPDNSVYHYRLAMAALQNQQTTLAEQELSFLLQQRPDDSNALKMLAYIQQTKNHPERAKSYYQQMLKPDVLLNYALLLQNGKSAENQDDIYAFAHTAELLAGNNLDVLYNISMLYLKLNRPTDAKRVLEQFIALGERQPTASKDRLDKATELLKSIK
jgi:Tfp pilus assembly protein PilF